MYSKVTVPCIGGSPVRMDQGSEELCSPFTAEDFAGKFGTICYLMVYKLLNCFAGDVLELRLVETIGQGSFGIVHKAVWCGSFAAKVISLPSADRDAVMKEIEDHTVHVVLVICMWLHQ